MTRSPNNRRHVRRSLPKDHALELLDASTQKKVEFIAVDISRNGIGAIIQEAVRPKALFLLAHAQRDPIEIEMVWIDYDAHEQRYRCGFRVVDQTQDLEAWAALSKS